MRITTETKATGLRFLCVPFSWPASRTREREAARNNEERSEKGGQRIGLERKRTKEIENRKIAGKMSEKDIEYEENGEMMPEKRREKELDN